MIKERYVNLEVARLLKDKSFDEECFAEYANKSCTKEYYDDYWEHKVSQKIKPGELIVPLIDKDKKYHIYGDTIPAPTQARACDWVRARNVLITYDLAPVGTALMVKVYKRVYDDPDFPWTEGITIIRSTLEEAINEALKYALEKLL